MSDNKTLILETKRTITSYYNELLKNWSEGSITRTDIQESVRKYFQSSDTTTRAFMLPEIREFNKVSTFNYFRNNGNYYDREHQKRDIGISTIYGTVLSILGNYQNDYYQGIIEEINLFVNANNDDQIRMVREKYGYKSPIKDRPLNHQELVESTNGILGYCLATFNYQFKD